MWFEARIERKKRKKNIPTMLKGINMCTEKENGHKHRRFYSARPMQMKAQNAAGKQRRAQY